jgi:hypothetical protein
MPIKTLLTVLFILLVVASDQCLSLEWIQRPGPVKGSVTEREAPILLVLVLVVLVLVLVLVRRSRRFTRREEGWVEKASPSFARTTQKKTDDEHEHEHD